MDHYTARSPSRRSSGTGSGSPEPPSRGRRGDGASPSASGGRGSGWRGQYSTPQGATGESGSYNNNINKNIELKKNRYVLQTESILDLSCLHIVPLYSTESSPALPLQRKRFDDSALLDLWVRCFRAQTQDAAAAWEDRAWERRAKMLGYENTYDAQLGNKQVDKNGYHQMGCPCEICTSMLDSLSDVEKDRYHFHQIVNGWQNKALYNPKILAVRKLSLITTSEPTKPFYTSYPAFCLQKKTKQQQHQTHR